MTQRYRDKYKITKKPGMKQFEVPVPKMLAIRRRQMMRRLKKLPRKPDHARETRLKQRHDALLRGGAGADAEKEFPGQGQVTGSQDHRKICLRLQK